MLQLRHSAGNTDTYPANRRHCPVGTQCSSIREAEGARYCYLDRYTKNKPKDLGKYSIREAKRSFKWRPNSPAAQFFIII